MRKLALFWGIYLVFVLTSLTIGALFHFGLINEWLLDLKKEERHFVIPGASKDKEKAQSGGDIKPIGNLGQHLDEALLEKLRGGGYTLYIRHGERPSYKDDATYDRLSLLPSAQTLPESFRAGACLNEEGKAQSMLLGIAIKTLNIPIGTIYSSPICRARETAQLAFGKIDQLSGGLVFDNVLATKKEKEENKKLGRAIMLASPQKGTNTVIVAHDPTLKSLGFPYQGLEQAGVLVFEHISGEEIQPIAKLPLKEWVNNLPVRLITESAMEQ